MYKSEDMASRIKKSFGSCEKTAAREVDAISRVGFDGVNRLMLVTWFSALPVLCLFPKLLRPVMKVEGEEWGETLSTKLVLLPRKLEDRMARRAPDSVALSVVTDVPW